MDEVPPSTPPFRSQTTRLFLRVSHHELVAGFIRRGVEDVCMPHLRNAGESTCAILSTEPAVQLPNIYVSLQTAVLITKKLRKDDYERPCLGGIVLK